MAVVSGPGRRVTGGVAEGRSGGQILRRLGRVALGKLLLHPLVQLDGIATRRVERRGENDRIRRKIGVPIGEAEVLRRQRHRLAVPRQRLGRNEVIRHIRTIAPRVHTDRAADRAGDGAKERQVQSRIGGLPRNRAVQRRRARRDAGSVDVDPGKGPAQPHHDAPHPAIPHDQVRPDTHREDRNVSRQRLQKRGKIVGIGGQVEPLRRPAHAQPCQRGEVAVGGEFPARDISVEVERHVARLAAMSGMRQ